MARSRSLGQRVARQGVRLAGAGQVARPSEPVDGRRLLLEQLSEQEFQVHVVALARRLGWRAWHDNATNAARRCGSCGEVRRLPRNTRGLPDLILVRRPRVIFAELKSEDGQPTPAQRDWLNALAECDGVETYLWKPSSWDEIEEVLSR